MGMADGNGVALLTSHLFDLGKALTNMARINFIIQKYVASNEGYTCLCRSLAPGRTLGRLTVKKQNIALAHFVHYYRHAF